MKCSRTDRVVVLEKNVRFLSITFLLFTWTLETCVKSVALTSRQGVGPGDVRPRGGAMGKVSKARLSWEHRWLSKIGATRVVVACRNMGKIQEFEITFDKNKVVYSPGDSISGTLKFKVTQSMPCKGEFPCCFAPANTSVKTRKYDDHPFDGWSGLNKITTQVGRWARILVCSIWLFFF